MNEQSLYLYITLLVAGVLMFGAELYVPGGILGTLGALMLLTAAAVGWRIFPAPFGTLSAIGIVLLSGIGLWAWARFFPRTPMGRKLILERDGKQQKASDDRSQSLMGMSGKAVAPLRPSGTVEIGGHRYDVITEGVWVEAGTEIQVVAVRGSRIIVRPAQPNGEPAERA